MPVTYEVRQVEPDVTIASLSGQLNLGSRLLDFEQNIRQRIEGGSRKMVMDLSGLTYIDSAGLGMVATCVNVMAKAGGRMVVVSAGGKITQMFEITRLNRMIGLFPTLDEALQSFSETPEAPQK